MVGGDTESVEDNEAKRKGIEITKQKKVLSLINKISKGLSVCADQLRLK
jgi:hypothetical protein